MDRDPEPRESAENKIKGLKSQRYGKYGEGCLIMDGTGDNPAFELAGVRLCYPDGAQVLKDVNIRVNFGELVFLTGESGSGKTSIINLIAGIKNADSGQLEVMGREISEMDRNEKRRLRFRVAVVYQNLRLIPYQTVFENVLLPLRFNENKPARPSETVEHAIELVGLADKLRKRASLLSGGEQQRVAIARALASGAQILLADEPTGNLDTENKRTVLKILKNLAERGLAVMVTTHDLSLIEGHRRYLLESGITTEV